MNEFQVSLINWAKSVGEDAAYRLDETDADLCAHIRTQLYAIDDLVPEQEKAVVFLSKIAARAYQEQRGWEQCLRLMLTRCFKRSARRDEIEGVALTYQGASPAWAVGHLLAELHAELQSSRPPSRPAPRSPRGRRR